MPEEIFDVVDEQDNVIGQAPRSEVHARGLLHRATSVFVFNSRGQLLLQKRSATKDEFPGCWTSSASGHLGAGESYDDCAPREMQEEIGINAPLQRLHKFSASPDMANEHTVLYGAETDDVPDIDRDEIERVAYFDLDDIAAMVDAKPDDFTPPFRVMFAWYVEILGLGERPV